MRRGGEALAVLEGGVLAFKPSKLSPTQPGKWVDENIGSSASARSGQDYAEFPLGTQKGRAYAVTGTNGRTVRFDNFDGTYLQEAKGNYDKFLNKKGLFYSWWRGRNSMVEQAVRQQSVAGSTPIQWVFKQEASMIATQRLFAQNGIEGISTIHKPMPGG